MEIIREGSQEKLCRARYFECSNCGAIWSAIKGEYKSDTQYNETFYYCMCPTDNCYHYGKEISQAQAEQYKDLEKIMKEEEKE